MIENNDWITSSLFNNIYLEKTSDFHPFFYSLPIRFKTHSPLQK